MKRQVVVVGSLNMDLVTQAHRFPQKGETILGQKHSQIRGGKGANQAVSAARLGASVSMIGAVGKDPFGQELKQALEEEGINTEGIYVTEQEFTGVAQITLAEQDNSIIVVPGANYTCTPDWIEQHQLLIKQADILLLQLEIPLETVEKAIELAYQYQVPVVLNPAPAAQLREDTLKKVTFLTPNETELIELVKGKVDDQSQLNEMILELIKAGVKHVVLTKGKDGVEHQSADEHLQTQGSNSYPSYNVEVVDTTGAGDAFNAGFAVGISEGKSISKAIKFGSAVAALAVTKYGAQLSMPLREEVERLLQDKGESQ